MKGNFETIARPEQPSGAILPEIKMRVIRRSHIFGGEGMVWAGEGNQWIWFGAAVR